MCSKHSIETKKILLFLLAIFLSRSVTIFKTDFREKRIKYDIIHNSNGTVTYKQNRTFHFVEKLSVGPESDRFTTPNPVYWVGKN